MNSAIGFKFPFDQSDQWDGFNDSGIEHFSGNPYVHLGREVTQNTLDARREDAKGPARIMIQLVDVPTDSIPDVKILCNAMKACLLAAKNESEKAQIFFSNALEILSKSKVSVLKISDYNTTGVRGPCENGSPYYALMKASGQSKKSGATAGGSYGIGKYAPFAVSGLRTMFVTTIWEGSDGWHQYVQGKSILMSHQDPTGKTLEGVGFFGIKERCLPVESADGKLPPWLLRAAHPDEFSKNIGTTLNILAFPGDKNWQSVLTATIAENFFGAISRGQLDVAIQGERFINKDTLEDIFSDRSIREAIKDMKDQPEHFDDVGCYLKALAKIDDVIVEHTEDLNLGHCELRIILGQKLPKRVAVLRNGMLITEELEGLRRFGDFKEFVAVLECQSTKGNELLRAMEPPRHDDFEPDRLPTDKEKRRGRMALKDVSRWVKDMLKRHAQNPVSEVTTVDELAEFFADEGAGEANNRNGEENPAGKLIIRARALPSSIRKPFYETSSGADDEPGDILIGKNQRPEGGPNNATGGQPPDNGFIESDIAAPTGSSSARVNLANVRSIPVSSTRRRIGFTPDFSGEIVVGFEDSGADRNYALPIVATNVGSIKQGRIQGINVAAGERYILEIEMGREFKGAMRVVAYAV